MIEFIGKLFRDRKGNVLAIAAACMPLVVGAAGLATDTIQWTLWKRQLQRAADSAAIAGVYERESANGATTTVDSTVSHDLSLNLHTFYGLKTGNPNCSGKCTLVFPADSGVETDQVTVTIAIQQRLPFSSFFLHTPPTITATATAASIPAGGDACIEALDTTSTTGVTFSGNAAVEMPDCDIFSNTSGTNSAIGRGSAAVTANSVGGVGGIQQSNNFTVNAYRPYSPALNDPYANVNPDPDDMHCTASALTPSTNFGSLASGTNCFSSLSVGPNQTLNIPASYSGPIYINGGGVDFKGTFNCSSCTIVLTNSSGSSTATIGQLTTNATANVNITAPTTGTYKGIAIMQDRRSTTCTGNCNTINGNSASVITGAVYFPNQEVWYNGTGTTTATCTMFVAKRITFTGNSGTSNKFKSLADCSSEGLPSNASVRMVRLVG